jgi:outer membrane protein assembly factor BamB
MREVELVELLDEADPAADSGDRDDAPRPPLAPSRWGPAAGGRTRNALLLVLAVVLAITGVVAVVSERREAARLRALADVPGVLAPLSGPPQELWRTDGWPMARIHEVDGRLVVVMRTRAHGLDAVALDPATGEVVWRTPLPSDAPGEAWADCVVPGAPGPDPGPDPAADPAPDEDAEPRPVLVCVVPDELATTTDGLGLDQYTYAVRARRLMVDARTGALIEDAPVTPPVSIASLGDDLLVGIIDDDGHGHVIRGRPGTGDLAWRFTTPEPVPEDQFGQRRMSVRAEGDLVVADAGTVWALSATGEVLLELPGAPTPFGGFTEVVGNGRFLARSPLGGDTVVTELVEVASGRSTTVEGYVVVPVPDDGSVPDVLLIGPTDDTGLVARDATSGETLWTVPGHDSGPPLVLDGRIVGVDGGRVEALDGGTGRVLWSTPVPGVSASSLVTDGRVVVAVTTDGRDGGLVALDLRDGRQVWSTQTDEQPHLVTDGDRLFGYGQDGLIAFGTRGRD